MYFLLVVAYNTSKNENARQLYSKQASIVNWNFFNFFLLSHDFDLKYSLCYKLITSSLNYS